jgi:hypothetical protein
LEATDCESLMNESYDWSKLPKHLHFLCKPAEKYGTIQFDDKILEFFKTASQAEFDEINAVADQSQSFSDEIERWLNDYPMTVHPESRVVYFLAHLTMTGYAIGKL